MLESNDTQTEKTPKVWPRTVSPELLTAWQRLKRKKDPETMAVALGYSRPVIDKALIYGYVSIPELTDKINTYFTERLKKENEQADALNQLADKVQPTQKP